MLTISSTDAVIDAMQHAKSIALTAYTLPNGRVLDALEAAAARGATVRVRLEGFIYKDDGHVGAANRAAVAALQRAGAQARLVHPRQDGPDAMLHLKSALVDDAVFLDDRNWEDDGQETIVRDDFAADVAMVGDVVRGVHDASTPFFAVQKRQALALEARLIESAQRGDDVAVETESFGASNRVYDALRDAAQRGAHVRLLVASREIANDPSERAAIAKLQQGGVDVRVADADEKFACVNRRRGWVGSTNATAAFDRPDQFDWGARTDDASIVRHVDATFASRWATARAVS